MPSLKLRHTSPYQASDIESRKNLPANPPGQEAQDVGEFISEVEGAAEVCEGLEEFHQEAPEDDCQ